MTVKLGILVAASVAAFAVKHITAKFTRPPNSLSNIIGEDVGTDHDEEPSLKKQDEKGETNCADSNVSPGEEKKEGLKSANFLVIDDIIDVGVANKLNSISSEAEFLSPYNKNETLSHSKGLEYEVEAMGSKTELERFRGLVLEMQEKQAKLEAQLLQCYSLEKQKLKLDKLRKQMKIKTIESKRMNLNIDSLITDHNKLQQETEQVDLEKKQLEIAMCRIKELQRKIEGNVKVQEQLQSIKNQVLVFKTVDESKRDASVRQPLKSEQNLKLEAMELKRWNKELQLEKRTLAIKLIISQARLTSISNTSESEIISGLRTEADKLRLVREELLDQVETLQKSRFMMIDEVVYMRWINACLHHELQIHQTSQTNDLSSTTNNIAKQLMLDEASIPHQKEESKSDQESFSSMLSSDESRHCDSTTLTDDSTCEEASVSKKSDLVLKQKRRGRRSNSDSSTVLTNESSSRGSSLSSTTTSCGASTPSSPEDVMDLKNMVESRILSTPMEVQNPKKSSDTSSLKLRKRRVSFSDSKVVDQLNTNKAEQTSKDTLARNTDIFRIQENITAPLHIMPENSSTEVHNKDLNIILIVMLFLFILLYFFLHK